MKHITFVTLLLLALGLGYWVTGKVLYLPSDTVSEEARLTWLAREFSLGPAETARIRRLQDDYAPICADHCAAIARAQKNLSTASTPAGLASARAELTRLEAICADATRAHLQAVAACMPPAQSGRFLALMEPRIAHSSGRTGAPSLDRAP